MTLLEMTVVILVLLTLVTVLYIGAQAWKSGSDRALCIMNLQNVQKGIRSFSNINAYDPGTTVSGLQDRLIGSGKFVEKAPNCPRGGTYLYGGDTIPAIGSLYMNCSLSTTSDHKPPNSSDW